MKRKPTGQGSLFEASESAHVEYPSICIYRIRLVKEESALLPHESFRTPSDIAAVASSFLTGKDQENFIVICLNTKNQPVGVHNVYTGSINACNIRIAEVFKAAILCNATSIAIAHNHPSGDTTPSAEDISVTRMIHEAGKLLGIELIDHVIVADENSGNTNAYSVRSHWDIWN